MKCFTTYTIILLFVNNAKFEFLNIQYNLQPFNNHPNIASPTTKQLTEFNILSALHTRAGFIASVTENSRGALEICQQYTLGV